MMGTYADELHNHMQHSVQSCSVMHGLQRRTYNQAPDQLGLLCSAVSRVITNFPIVVPDACILCICWSDSALHGSTVIEGRVNLPSSMRWLARLRASPCFSISSSKAARTIMNSAAY